MAQSNKPDLSALLGNRKAVEQLAGSTDARNLISLLTKTHDPKDLQSMAQSAMSGDTTAIQTLIQSITDSPEGAELLRRLGTSFGDK